MSKEAEEGEAEEPTMRELHELPPSQQEQQQGQDPAQFTRAQESLTAAAQELGPGASEKTILDRAGELFELAELAAMRILRRNRLD